IRLHADPAKRSIVITNLRVVADFVVGLDVFIQFPERALEIVRVGDQSAARVSGELAEGILRVSSLAIDGAIYRLRHIHSYPAAIRSRVGFGAGSRVRELVYRVCVQAGDGQTARIDGIEAYVRAMRHADDHPERLFHALRNAETGRKEKD